MGCLQKKSTCKTSSFAKPVRETTLSKNGVSTDGHQSTKRTLPACLREKGLTSLPPTWKQNTKKTNKRLAISIAFFVRSHPLLYIQPQQLRTSASNLLTSKVFSVETRSWRVTQQKVQQVLEGLLCLSCFQKVFCDDQTAVEEGSTLLFAINEPLEIVYTRSRITCTC